MIDYEKRWELYVDAVARWGAPAQVKMAMEKCTELVLALLKFEREGGKDVRREDRRLAVAEEMADIEVMLEQLKLIFDNSDAVKKWKRIKLQRLEGRLVERELAEKARPSIHEAISELSKNPVHRGARSDKEFRTHVKKMLEEDGGNEMKCRVCGCRMFRESPEYGKCPVCGDRQKVEESDG